MKLLAVLVIAPGLASAQIYKCTGVDGKINLTDRPCASGESATVVDMPPAPETAYERMMRESKESIARSNAQIAALREQSRKSRMELASRYWGRTLREGLEIGMTSQQVLELDAWGFPDDKRTTETKRLRREQWIYHTSVDNEMERMYLYFHNGRLVTIQD